ncbi:MAG: hypothetical protein Q7S33_01955 [Nanoarchaeota archaeon]|nr:hypothetical protein [Nanoarchaeota archaeon]
MKNITTIKLKKETKLRLEKLREHNRESYDEILRKMLGILNVAKTEPEKSKSILDKIDEHRIRVFGKEKKKIKTMPKQTQRISLKNTSKEILIKMPQNKPIQKSQLNSSKIKR